MNELVPTFPALPVEASDRLHAWAIEAREALSASTQRAYAIDSRAFASWCAANGHVSLPAAPATVSAFLRAEIAVGKSVATVRRRAATISRMHMAAGLPNPCAHDLVRLALKGIAKSVGTDQRQAAGLTDRDTVTIRAHMGDSARDLRDVALMLVGRDLLARASELVAITIEDLELAPAGGQGGALLRLRRHKTSTETHPCFIGPEALQALQAWVAKAGITSGPMFCSVNKAGRATGTALSTRDVQRILKGVAVRCRLPHAATVSGHSLRVGMAQDLVAADLDVASVMQAGGWSTPRMVARYTEKLTAHRGAVARYYGKR
jgi:site-specific recombinase XerD